MKVIILHQHFKTPQGGGAIRSYYLAKALVEKGVETVVITAHNEAEAKQINIEGISVEFLPVAYDNRFGFYQRVVSFFRFMRKAADAAGRHSDADVCYAISTPLTTGWAARMISRRYGVHYLFEVGDLWPDAPVEMGFIRNGLVRNILYRMERVIYKSASSIVALSEPIRDAILKKVPGKAVHVIPNMSDIDFFRPADKQRALEERFGVKDRFVVSYIGALGVANGLEYFLDCAAAAQRAGLSVHFLVCGDGAMAGPLKRKAANLRLENLTFTGFLNRVGVREVMNVTDANFICYQPLKILETGSPNKYFDGLAAGRLTVVNFGGWVKEEIEQSKCGISVAAGDAEDFVKKITPFLKDKDLLMQYQRAARSLAEEKYSRRKLGGLFVDVIFSSPRTSQRVSNTNRTR